MIKLKLLKKIRSNQEPDQEPSFAVGIQRCRTRREIKFANIYTAFIYFDLRQENEII